MFVQLKDYGRPLAAKILSIDQDSTQKAQFTVVVDDRDRVTQQPIFEIKVVEASDVYKASNAETQATRGSRHSDYGAKGRMDTTDDAIWLFTMLTLFFGCSFLTLRILIRRRVILNSGPITSARN